MYVVASCGEVPPMEQEMLFWRVLKTTTMHRVSNGLSCCVSQTMPTYSMVYSYVSSRLSPHTQCFFLSCLPNYPHILNAFFCRVFLTIPTYSMVYSVVSSKPSPHTQLRILARLPIYYNGPNMFFRHTQYVILAFQPSTIAHLMLFGHVFQATTTMTMDPKCHSSVSWNLSQCTQYVVLACPICYSESVFQLIC